MWRIFFIELVFLQVGLNTRKIHDEKNCKCIFFIELTPGLIFVQNGFLLNLFSGELIFGGGLVIGGSFAFQNGFGLTIKTLSLKHKDNS